MLDGLGLNSTTSDNLRTELQANFRRPASVASFTRIDDLIAALAVTPLAGAGAGVASDSGPSQTETKKLCLRLFLKAKKHYLETGDASLIAALLRQELTDDTIQAFVKLSENKAALEALRDALTEQYEVWRDLVLHPGSHLKVDNAFSTDTRTHGALPQCLRRGKLTRDNPDLIRQRSIQATLSELAEVWNALQALLAVLELAQQQADLGHPLAENKFAPVLDNYLAKSTSFQKAWKKTDARQITLQPTKPSNMKKQALAGFKAALLSHIETLRSLVEKRLSPTTMERLEACLDPDGGQKIKATCSYGMLWWRADTDIPINLAGIDLTDEHLIGADLRHCNLASATLPQSMQLVLLDEAPDLPPHHIGTAHLTAAQAAIKAGPQRAPTTTIVHAIDHQSSCVVRTTDTQFFFQKKSTGSLLPALHDSEVLKIQFGQALVRGTQPNEAPHLLLNNPRWARANPFASSACRQKEARAALIHSHLLRCIVTDAPLFHPEGMSPKYFKQYTDLAAQYRELADEQKTQIRPYMRFPFSLEFITSFIKDGLTHPIWFYTKTYGDALLRQLSTLADPICVNMLLTLLVSGSLTTGTLPIIAGALFTLRVGRDLLYGPSGATEQHARALIPSALFFGLLHAAVRLPSQHLWFQPVIALWEVLAPYGQMTSQLLPLIPRIFNLLNTLGTLLPKSTQTQLISTLLTLSKQAGLGAAERFLQRLEKAQQQRPDLTPEAAVAIVTELSLAALSTYTLATSKSLTAPDHSGAQPCHDEKMGMHTEHPHTCEVQLYSLGGRPIPAGQVVLSTPMPDDPKYAGIIYRPTPSSTDAKSLIPINPETGEPHFHPAVFLQTIGTVTRLRYEGAPGANWFRASAVPGAQTVMACFSWIPSAKSALSWMRTQFSTPCCRRKRTPTAPTPT